jgi:hypothetical protein
MPRGFRSVIGHIDGTRDGVALYGPTYAEANFQQREARLKAGLIGRGAYSAAGASHGAGILSNDLMGGGAVPSFGEGGSIGGAEGSLTVRHAEYIGNILGNGYVNGISGAVKQFDNQTFSINPGLETTFPWLSQVAQNYDEYTMISCVYTYRTMVTDFAANSGQVGQVYMAAQYNNNDSPFTTTRAFLDYASAVSGKTSQTIMMGLECDPAKISLPGGKYTRTGPPLPGLDLNTLDSGILNIAVVGTPESYANQIMGQLWVSYVVELRKPKSFVNQCLGNPKDIYMVDTTNYDTNYTWSAAGPTAIFLINGSNIASGQQNRIGTELVLYGSNASPLGVTPTQPAAFNWSITFPPDAVGSYEILLTSKSQYAITPSGTTFTSPFTFLSSRFAQSISGSGMAYINDLWSSGATPGNGDWVAWNTTRTTVTGAVTGGTTLAGVQMEPDEQTLLLHVSVTPTSDGTLNNVNVALQVAPAFASNFFEKFDWQLQITEYNRGLNNPATQAPYLLDQSGVAISQPPTVSVLPVASAASSASAIARLGKTVRVPPADALLVHEVRAAEPSPSRPAKRPRKKVTVKDLKEDLELEIPE